MIDQGARFFKWDAINTFICTSPLHHHGGARHEEKERGDNYGFLLPIYIKKAMAELTAYEPDLVIKIDLTENRRQFLAVTNNSYDLRKNSLILHFRFPVADASGEAFIHPNENSGINIIRSTSWLDNVRITDGRSRSYIEVASAVKRLSGPKVLGNLA